MIAKPLRGLRAAGAFALVLGACASACGTDKERNDAHGDAAVTAGGSSGAGTGGAAGKVDTPTSSGGASASAAGGNAPSSSDGGNSSGGSSGRGSGGKSASAGAGGVASGGAGNAGCDAPGLVWKTANKTHYTSYPDPGSEECIKYNGCMWAGQFAACDDTKPEAWVSAHDIVAAFPDFTKLSLHDLCLRKGSKSIVVTVLDTCGDSDCDGCCTQNKGDADELIDIESYTNDRWGIADGRIDWADLGPTKGAGCN